MIENFFSEYGFDREVSHVSKVDALNFKYPQTKHVDINKNDSLYSFFSNAQINEIPLNVHLFDKNINSQIIFDCNLSLIENYSPEKPLIIENTNLNVNLNGKKITAPVFAEKNGNIYEGNTDSYVFWVKNGSNLTIDGEGEVVAQKATYSIAVWANGGNVIIKNGKFYNNGDNSDLIYASNGSSVEIYGGEFHANENKGAIGTKNKFPALNIKDSDRKNTTIKVYGGKFYGFNPQNNVSEGVDTNFVADGYKSIEIEPNIFEVVKE